MGDKTENKDKFTLRIPSQMNREVKSIADEMGIAQNALILMFIREGLKGYKESDSLNK